MTHYLSYKSLNVPNAMGEDKFGKAKQNESKPKRVPILVGSLEWTLDRSSQEFTLQHLFSINQTA